MFALFPGLAERGPRGRLSLRRRAADARHGPRPDDRAEVLMLDEPSLGLSPNLVDEIFEGSVRAHRRRARRRRAPRRAERHDGAVASPSHGYVHGDRPDRARQARRRRCSRDDDVREFYLGLDPARTASAGRSATSSTTGARSGGRHDRGSQPRSRRHRAVLDVRRRAPVASPASRRSTVSASRSSPASCSRSSAPTAPARPRSSTCSPASTGRSAGTRRVPRRRDILGRRPHRDRARSAWPARSRTCVLFTSLTVLDNLMVGRPRH